MAIVKEAKPNSRADRLVRFLNELVKNDDRGALAELRRGAGEYPNYGERVLRQLGRAGLLASSDSPMFLHEENALLMVATLFALHRTRADTGKDIGGVLNDVVRAKGEASRDAIERRFLALLGAEADDLHEHLRHAVSLADGANVGVGWQQLALDVEALLSGNEDRRQWVVRRWSRSFWAQANEDSKDASQEANAED